MVLGPPMAMNLHKHNMQQQQQLCNTRHFKVFQFQAKRPNMVMLSVTLDGKTQFYLFHFLLSVPGPRQLFGTSHDVILDFHAHM